MHHYFSVVSRYWLLTMNFLYQHLVLHFLFFILSSRYFICHFISLNDILSLQNQDLCFNDSIFVYCSYKICQETAFLSFTLFFVSFCPLIFKLLHLPLSQLLSRFLSETYNHGYLILTDRLFYMLRFFWYIFMRF